MKLIKYIFAIGVVSLSMTACEDWLEENPKYSMDNTVIFDSQETAEQALDACYGYLTSQDCFGQGLYEMSVGGSGLSWSQTNGAEADRTRRFAAAAVREGGQGERGRKVKTVKKLLNIY